MGDGNAQFIIRGARGTIPACGSQYARHGGNTSCFTVRTEHGLLIFDAGTGIASVGAEAIRDDLLSRMALFFTHFHLDHVIGLPCFDPLYLKKSNLAIYADPRRRDDWRKTLNTLMEKPFWPVGLGDCAALMKLKDVPVEQKEMELYGVRISWFRVPHPQQCLAYRVTLPDVSIVIATDMEHDTNVVQPDFMEFCLDADFLICDAHFTPQEYPAHCGWGHSTWEAGVLIARAANVRHLVLTHHAPNRTDSEIDSIVAQARAHFPSVCAAMENMRLKKDFTVP